MHKAVLLALLLFMAFVAGCGGQAASPPEERPQEEAPETTSEPTQAPPRDAEEAAADEAKRRAAEQGARATAPEERYEAVSVTEGTAAYEGPQGAATVYATSPTEGGMQAFVEQLLAENPEYDMMIANFYPEGQEQAPANLIGVRYAFASPEIKQAFYGDVEGSIDDIIAEQCASWTPEDYESLGPPPAEWNCEQYQ
ncbi:MAG: hypothetical protein CYG60_07810 [Actinobacteria bacterium]|nr:MAG: hypothetical protein CYG60_07810 [Actinomycetota bacterium]